MATRKIRQTEKTRFITSLQYHKVAVLVLALLFFISLAVPADLFAEIYTYEDDNGIVHFSNVPTDPQYRMIIPPKEEAKQKNKKDSPGSRQVEYNKLITEKSYQYGLDPALVRAVIAVESDFNPRAVSDKGAMGLMQLMPLTARELGVSDTFDPTSNVDGGTRYLRYLLDSFNWDIELALAAYHAGKSRVERNFGIPPIPATHNYVKKVKKTYSKYVYQ